MAGLPRLPVSAGGTLRLPSEEPESWNTLTINGERVPGLILFPQFEVARDIDAKESPGSDAFALTDKGAKCTEVEIEIHLWTADHFRDFAGIYSLYLDPRRPLKRRNVVTVVHPTLYFAGIKQIYFCAATALIPVGDPQQQRYIVRCKGKEFNAKTRLGGGSTVVKADLSRIGKSAKWAKTGATAQKVYGPPVEAAAPAPFTPQSMGAQVQAARQGDAGAQFTSANIDAAAKAAGYSVQPG